MQHGFYTLLMRVLGILAVVVFIQIPTVVLAEPAQSENSLVHNLVGAWIGTATNNAAKVSSEITVVVVTSGSQQVRAFGGFDNKTLFGSIDAKGYQVPCSKVVSKGTDRCFDLAGILRLGDDGSGFPSGTQAGLHISLQVKSGTNGVVVGDYRVAPIANFVPTPQLGTLNLPKILEEPDASLTLAQGLHLSLEHEAALAIYAQLLSSYPNDAFIYWQRGYWLGKLKRYDAAIPDLRRVTMLKPEFGDAWGLLGWYLLLQGDFPAAQVASAKAQALAPDSFPRTINLGHTYFLQGDDATARVWYKKSMPLLLDEAALQSGPLADFDIFIAQGWRVAATRQERAWYENEAKPLVEATVLNRQVMSLLEQGKYAEAVPLAKRALAIREKALGPEHPDVATSLNNLASLYESQGQYAQAEPLYQRALAIHEKVLGPEHPHVATSLNNLAGLYQSQGQYAQAEPLYQRSLAIREKVLGPEHPDVAQSLNNLAALYQSQGQYAQAEPLYQRALAIWEKVLGPEHPDVATSLNNLAELYRSQGQYAQAEPLYQRALAIREKVLGPEHPDVAASLNNLALLYDSQGQYAQAEPLYQRALAIREKVLGPEHPHVATSLNNLAGLYQSQGQYAQAEPLFKRALAIREKVLGPEHPDVAASLNNLAGLYKSQGQYAQAEPLYQRALAIVEKALGPEHPHVAASLNNLAVLYQSQGQYTQAEPLYQRALAILEKVLGPEHPDVATSLGNMARLYYAQNQYSLALDYIRRASGIYQQRILNNSRVTTSGGDSERGGFKGTFAWHLKMAAARLAEAPSMGAELTAESFEIGQLFHDGAVGDALAKMAARFAGGNDQLANLARDKEDAQMAWQKADANLIEALGKPTAEQNSTLIQNLRTQAQGLQTELTRLNERLAKEFPDYVELTIPRPATIPQVQKLLNPGEGLVAYVLGRTKSWVWLITPDAASFRQIDRTGKDIEKQVQELRASLSPDSNPRLDIAFPAAVAHALYQDLLGPEAERLAKVKTLFVVADGALESLPFAVLVTAQPIGDPKDYQNIPWLSRTWATTTLPTVSSLRALRTLATKGKPAPKPFIGFGNPDFGTSDSGATRSGRSSKTRRSTTGTTKDRSGMTLALTRGAMANPDELRKMLPLPETADELRAIAKTLGAAPTAVILGKKATVPAVITSPLAQYRVVDFATHALVAGQMEEFKLGDKIEPAIVLTPPKVATPDNDGLLRASQVAQLKLNADWVVLSACNTAAPDGTPGAVGLSGLAKAFFYAGARAMLVSHWSVLSEPAVGITTHMFKTWNNHPELGRAEALRLAMMNTLDNPTDRRYAHPAAWAPFVVAGEGGIDVTRTSAVDFSMFHTTVIAPIPIAEGATLKSGDGYFFHIKTTDASQNYFYVYQVDSANKVFRLFPNTKYRTATNPIPANTRITVPNDGEEFFLDHVTGKETFYFFASATPVPALERLENGAIGDLTRSGLPTRGPAGTRTKMDTVAASTGETTSETQQFRFAEHLTHSFSINHK